MPGRAAKNLAHQLIAPKLRQVASAINNALTSKKKKDLLTYKPLRRPVHPIRVTDPSKGKGHGTNVSKLPAGTVLGTHWK